MSKENKIFILFFVIGYFLIMFLRKFISKKKDLKKITFLGIAGAVALSKNPYASGTLAGASMYELGEEAGLSYHTPETLTLGRVKNPIKVDTLKIKDNKTGLTETYKVSMSEWFFPYIKEKGKKRKTTLHQYITNHPEEETGIYFIRDSDTKDILYIGMSNSQNRGIYERIYRKFQKKHDDFNKVKYVAGRNGDNYQIRVITINNPTWERLWLLEKYYQEFYDAPDSSPAQEEQDQDYQNQLKELERERAEKERAEREREREEKERAEREERERIKNDPDYMPF